MNRVVLFVIVGFICAGWFQKESPELLSVEMSPTGVPLTSVEIEGTKYSLKLDLGAKAFLMLDQSLISKIHKKNYGFTDWMDLKGNVYHTARYLIPKIGIGNTLFNEILADELPHEFIQNTKLFSDDCNIPCSGAIGWPILKRRNVFLDFPHQQFMLVRDTNALSSQGITLDKMIKSPFVKSRSGIVLTIYTDLGNCQFLLDTGSTLTLIRKSLVNDRETCLLENELTAYQSKEFTISGTNFGSQWLHAFPLVEELADIDGVLGMDFFSAHQIYIDYFNRELYIGKK